MELHETARFSMKDSYFVTGGNPVRDSGGGVIGSAPTLAEAHKLQEAAIKQDYRRVRVLTWDEFNGVWENADV